MAKHSKKLGRRLLSVILSLTMVLSLVNITAFAAETDTVRKLTCGLEESESHTHTDECYAPVESEPEVTETADPETTVNPEPETHNITVKFNDGEEAGGHSFAEQTYYPEKRDDGNYEYLFNTSTTAHAAQVDDKGNPMWTGYIFTGWARSEDMDGNVTYTAQWEKDVPKGPVPSLEVLQYYTKVTVNCVTEDGKHASESYSLLPDSYTVSGPQNHNGSSNWYSVTVNADKYVDAYSAANGAHTLVESHEPQVFWFKHSESGQGNYEWLLDGFSSHAATAPFNVKHEVEEPPVETAPTYDDLKDLLHIHIYDTTEVNGTRLHGEKTYDLIDGTFTVSEPADGKYTVTVTTEKYVEQFNTDVKTTHTVDEKTVSAVVFKDTDGQWKVVGTPVSVNHTISVAVKCEEPTPPEPEKHTYTLTFDANGGKFGTGGGYIVVSDSIREKVDTIAEESYTFTKSMINGQTPPVRDGYTFKGWTNVKDNADAIVTDVTVTKEAPNATIYALWEENAPETPTGSQIKDAKVTIICINNQNLGHVDIPNDLIAKSVIEVSEPELGEDGKWYSTFKVDASNYTHKYDTTDHHDAAPAPEHNDGTYKIVYTGEVDKKGNQIWKLAEGEDIKVYVRDMVTYSIQYVFKDAEGNVFEPTGDLAALVAKFAKGGKYRSVGQYIDTKPDNKTSYTSNLENEYPTPTMYPKYIDDNGTLYACDKDNYSFNISNNVEENVVTVTYQAQSAKHTVTFDYNDGDETHKDTVEVVDGNTTDNVYPTVGDKMPENPIRDGYIFDGWKDEVGTDFNGDYPVSGDVKVHATWKDDANKNGTPDDEETRITVTFEDGQGNDLYKAENILPETDGDYTDLYTETPTRSGYTFNGWSAPVTDEDGNVTYTAQWTENTPAPTPTPTPTPGTGGGTGGGIVTPTNPEPTEPAEPEPTEPGTEIPDEQPPLAEDPTGGDDTEIPDEQPPLAEDPTGGDNTEIPDEEPPLSNLPDEQPPLAEEPTGGDSAEIPDEEPPRAELPDEQVPLDASPKTGDDSRLALWTTLALTSAAGLFLLRKEEEEEA